MTVRSVPVLIAASWLCACDFEFIEIVTPVPVPDAVVEVVAEQLEELRAGVVVRHSGVDGPVSVIVAGVPAQMESLGARQWRGTATVVLDTLAPELIVEMDAGSGVPWAEVVGRLPVRSGPAYWLDGGDLALPLAGLMFVPAPLGSAWRVTFQDASSRRLAELEVADAAPPNPLVVHASIVPTVATSAHVRLYQFGTIPDAPYSVRAAVTSTVVFALPERE
jgi:hypothetical protein